MAQPPHPATSTEADAIDLIVKAGYLNPVDLEQRGHTWHASATDSQGAVVQVVVDPHGGVHLADTDA